MKMNVKTWATEQIKMGHEHDPRRGFDVAFQRLMKSTPSVYSREEFAERREALKDADDALRGGAS